MITRDLAVKIRDLIDQGLVKGMGNPKPGEMCVEATICFAMGLPHGDEPTCVSPALRALKISLNDADWSTSAARAKGMRRLGLAQLGSADALDDKEFARRVVKMTIARVVPRALRAAALVCLSHSVELEAAAVLCESTPTERSADAAARAADAAARAADAARSAADAAARAADAARSARSAADAATRVAVEAARSAADAADAARVDASAAADAADTSLSLFAEDVVRILIDMSAPGCQWLDLVPVK